MSVYNLQAVDNLQANFEVEQNDDSQQEELTEESSEQQVRRKLEVRKIKCSLPKQRLHGQTYNTETPYMISAHHQLHILHDLFLI